MTKNYAYGIQSPELNGNLVREQIRLAHRYQNRLIEIDRTKRERMADARRVRFPGFDELEKQYISADETVELAIKSLSRDRADARSKKGGTPEQREAVKSAKAKRKEIADALKQRRQECNADPAMKDDYRRIQEDAYQAIRDARAVCGVYWGTYLLIEDAAKRASAGKTPPRFQRFTGEGAIGVQLQGGMTWDEATAGDGRMKIEIIREKPNGKHIFRVHLRIGSNGRDPIWMSATGVLHRPLPDGVSIKWAKAIVTRTARQERWQLILTIDTPDAAKPAALSGRVAIDVGWRLVPEGLRVAYYRGSDGAEGSLVLPELLTRRWRKVDDLEAIRDLQFNEARDAIKTWLTSASVPDWVKERTETLHQWRSQGRLAALAIHWRANRFDGDGIVFAMLEAWRKQDAHLWEWADHQRKRCQRQRREVYRLFACDLRKRYAIAIVEDSNWSRLAKDAPAESDTVKIAAVRYNQRVAAVSEIMRAMTDCGPTCEKVSAIHSTSRCHACGETCDVDGLKSIIHACEHCGAAWDIDANAARNLLASGDVPIETRESREVQSDEILR